MKVKVKAVSIIIIAILVYRLFFSYAILRIPLNEENVGGKYYTYMNVINPFTTKNMRERIREFDGGRTLPPLSKRAFAEHFDKRTFEIVDIYDNHGYTLVFVKLGVNTHYTAVYYFSAGEIKRVFL